MPTWLSAQTIVLHKKDAVVWARDQIIEGETDTVGAREGVLYLNGEQISFSIPAPGNSFSIPITISEGENTVVVRLGSGESAVQSDTLRLTLGYKLRPEIYAFATTLGRTVALHTAVIDNPEASPLRFMWRQDPDNPQPLVLTSPADSTLTLTVPEDASHGEYYFDLHVVDADGDSVRARTFVTVEAAGIRPFNIKIDHAAWIDRAVIYEITPYNFVSRGRFTDVAEKLAEIASLGVTTIWLQPIYQTYYRGQGYDVTDYFAVRPDLGTQEDLRNLIETAKSLGLRVLFDFVPNHTSIQHPYAQDAIRYGRDSHYYDYYWPLEDGVRYSMHYHTRTLGKMTFNYYFWEDLPNLNYDNPEVQRMMIEAGKRWIQKFDIDGYRIDAAWGINARNPEFMKKWRLALKRIKPEILLLGEDKATDPTGLVFDERFDVAYDWFPEEPWVSHWVWQTFYTPNSNPTIFNNSNQRQRAALLRNSLTNNGRGYHPRAKILRFMENNDTFRFLPTHDLARTKMVATLMFSLHGIPLLYQGQEIGASTHPYQTFSVFSRSSSIASLDAYGLIPLYRDLNQIRQTYPALYSANFEEVSVTPNDVAFAYRRWDGTQNIFGLINMGNSAISASLSIPADQLGLDSSTTYYLSDLLSGEVIAAKGATLPDLEIPMNEFSTRLFVLADSVVVTSVRSALTQVVNPQEFTLAQNYPNPFNPSTTIAFSLPRSGRVSLKIYDVLGREIETLLDEERDSGHHHILFNGANLSSGVYFYRLETAGKAILRKMLLVK